MAVLWLGYESENKSYSKDTLWQYLSMHINAHLQKHLSKKKKERESTSVVFYSLAV